MRWVVLALLLALVLCVRAQDDAGGSAESGGASSGSEEIAQPVVPVKGQVIVKKLTTSCPTCPDPVAVQAAVEKLASLEEHELEAKIEAEKAEAHGGAHDDHLPYNGHAGGEHHRHAHGHEHEHGHDGEHHDENGHHDGHEGHDEGHEDHEHEHDQHEHGHSDTPDEKERHMMEMQRRMAQLKEIPIMAARRAAEILKAASRQAQLLSSGAPPNTDPLTGNSYFRENPAPVVVVMKPGPESQINKGHHPQGF